MDKTLIKNTTIISLDEARPSFFQGDILIKNGLIEKISEKPGSIALEGDHLLISGEDYLFMPGLINAHGHAGMTLLRGYADDLPLKQWLEDKIWPIEEHITGEDIYWGSMLAICEMLKGGTTTFTDMYFFVDRVADAVAKSKMRAVLSRGLVGVGPSAEIGLLETEELINTRHGTENGRINIILGPHAPYTCPPTYLKKVMALAEKTGRPLNIHLSESAAEVKESYDTYGKSPILLVEEIGLFNHHVLAAHCVHLSEEDMQILEKRKVSVAHNPISNLKLGSGVAKVTRMLEKGINVALGTDGAASNNNLDMFEEMRTCALLQKGVLEDPALLEAKTALQIATINGAKALGLENTGLLKEGWKADLIGVNLKKPHLTPLHNPLAHAVYAASAADVHYVIVDGELLVEKGVLKTIDEAEVMFEAQKCAQRLVLASKNTMEQ